MTTWVLILTLAIGAPGRAEIHSIRFATEAQCRKALVAWENANQRTDMGPRYIAERSAVCVEWALQ